MQLKKQFRPVPYEVAGIQYQIHPFAAMDSYLYIVLYSTIILLLENQHSRAHFSY